MQNLEDQSSPQPSPRDFFFVLFKQKNKAGVFFLVVMGMVIAVTLLSQRVYQSEAKLFIKLGRETVAQNSTAAQGQRIMVSQTLESQINSEIEILKSQELALRVVENLGLDSFEENSPKYMNGKIPLIVNVRLTLKEILAWSQKMIGDYFTISNPDDALNNNSEFQLIAEQISENLQVQVIQDSNIILITYDSLFPHLSRDVLDQLIALYLEKHLKLLVAPESFEFFKKESARFRRQLEATEKKIQTIKDNTGTGYTASAVDELRNTLHELRLKEQELLSTFTETSVPVTEIRRQIRKSETQIEEQLRINNETEVRLTQLEREKELLEKNYQKYSDTLEQTRIDQALEAEKISNIRIAQAPNVPLEPTSPDVGLNLGLGLFLALFGGLGLAFFIEYMDVSLQKPEQIEEVLNIPVIGSIQEMGK